MAPVLKVEGNIVQVEAAVLPASPGFNAQLTLASWPYYLDSTVGAAVATRSHGSSVKYGTVADFVVACRVATSTEDVWYDGESFDITAVKGVLTVVSLRCMPLFRVKRSVATTDSLDAGWLRSIREHDHAWVWWDAASGKAAAMALDADDEGEVYDGRNWSPYAPEVTRLLGPPVAGEDCYTAQYAVPDAAADAGRGRKSGGRRRRRGQVRLHRHAPRRRGHVL